jgi:hypothetical protein
VSYQKDLVLQDLLHNSDRVQNLCYSGTMNKVINNYRDKVDKKLIIRQRLFFLIILVLVTIGIVNVSTGKISVFIALSGFVVTTLIGLGLSRMFKIFWHQEKEKVISQLDTMGVILLILYISIKLGRNWIFGHWLSGSTLTTFGLIILTGLLFGRFLGTLIRINKVLSDN